MNGFPISEIFWLERSKFCYDKKEKYDSPTILYEVITEHNIKYYIKYNNSYK